VESLYDIELRRCRIDPYADLWKLLEPLAYWSPPRPLTYAGIGQLQQGKERELNTPIERDGPRAGQTPKVTVTLAGRRQVGSSETPDVPLRTPVLERLGPGS
jgi:hypothetical protein